MRWRGSEVHEDSRRLQAVHQVRERVGCRAYPRSRGGVTQGVVVVGGGLAGSEAAWQLATRGIQVSLHEMRPTTTTPAHKTDGLAELVCSNTFKSTELTNAHGLLKAEMRLLGSLILEAADGARVAAGSALAVDRDAFSRNVTARISGERRVAGVREEVTGILSPTITATGPLHSGELGPET